MYETTAGLIIILIMSFKRLVFKLFGNGHQLDPFAARRWRSNPDEKVRYESFKFLNYIFLFVKKKYIYASANMPKDPRGRFV